MLMDKHGRVGSAYSIFKQDQEANHAELTFRCCDLEVEECNWQTDGNTEDEVVRWVEEHFREKQDFAFDLATQIMVRQAIRKRAGIAKEQTEGA
jgi:predicted small metal-binding protein